ncbi:hypothetical protein ABPG75_012055 [Micractinium tetrahymenae]
MEGLSLRQQAAEWARASLVQHVHGAALGDYFFLPRHAVTVQLAPMGDFFDARRYTQLLQQDFAGVSDVETLEWQNRDPSRDHLITENVEASLWRHPEWRRFMEDRETYGQFLSTYSCPPAWPKEQRAACKNLLYHLNTHIDIETVAFNLTDAAIKRAFEKQGRPLPADMLAGGAEGSSGSGEGSQEDGSSSGGNLAARGAERGGGAAPAVLQQHLAAGDGGLTAALAQEGGIELLLLGVAIGAVAAGVALSSARRGRKQASSPL